LTFPELICNLTSSAITSTIPWWAIHYFLTQPLKEILSAAASRTEQDTIPPDANVYILRTLNLGRLLRRRWIDTGDDGAHMMVLALYRTTGGEINPLILIDIEYTVFPRATARLYSFCLAEAQWPPRLSGASVRSICTLFAVDRDSETRLHLRPVEIIQICDENCLWPKEDPNCKYVTPNTYKYLGDRSRVCLFLQRIASDSSFDPKFTPGWENTVHVSGSDAKPLSWRAQQQPRILDYHRGIQEEDAALGVDSNDDAAEMEDISPTASEV
ncbi:MAG: hypothetical protein Q9208_000801, partial [Pyrenodesmia sp. 3 TL-2023]